MPVCGPKLSLCGIILSVWGVIQLALMGVFYYVHSVALAEDIYVKSFEELSECGAEPCSDAEIVAKFNESVDDGYTQGAYNCWIAAAAYFGLLLVSAQQFYANVRK